MGYRRFRQPLPLVVGRSSDVAPLTFSILGIRSSPTAHLGCEMSRPVDLGGFYWISDEMWDFVLGWLVPRWLEINSNSIENMENASTPDSYRERLISPFRVRHTGDKL